MFSYLHKLNAVYFYNQEGGRKAMFVKENE